MEENQKVELTSEVLALVEDFIKRSRQHHWLKRLHKESFELKVNADRRDKEVVEELLKEKDAEITAILDQLDEMGYPNINLLLVAKQNR